MTEGRARSRCSGARIRSRVVDHPAGGQRDGGEQDDAGGEEQTGGAGEAFHPLVGVPGEEPEGDETGRPDHRAERVVGQEPAVGHVARAGDEGHHRAQQSDEPTEEDRASAAATHVLLGAVPALVADAAGEAAAAQRTAEAPAELVADRVPDDCTDRGAGHHRRQAGSAGERQHPPEQHRGLAGDDQPDERGGFHPGEHSDDDMGPGAGKPEHAVEQGTHPETPMRFAAGVKQPLLLVM